MVNWNKTPADLHDALMDISNGVGSGGSPQDGVKIEAGRGGGWTQTATHDQTAETVQPAESAEMVHAYADEPVWAHKKGRYEWKEEYGDVGPEVPELEKELFHDDLINRQGLKFDKLMSIKVTAEAVERPAPIVSFHEAGLHPIMLDNVKKCGYVIPTPTQAYSIPAVISGRDLISTAQTGSGKTAAYLIPTLSKLMGKAKKLCAARPNLANGFDAEKDRVRAEPLILCIAPTRELCCQIFDEARRLSYRSMLRPCVAYGGGPVRDQKDEMRKGCDILIATPGRLKDFLSDPGLLVLSRLRFTIVDEADELLHNDWEEEVGPVLAAGSDNAQHQYLFFSATFDKNMRKVAKKYLANDHVRIRIGRAGSVHANVTQQIVYVERNQKQQALYDLLIASPPARTLVFCRSKKSCDFIDDFLYNHGMPSTSIHSDRTQREREDALRAFRAGTAPILIATNVSGRGLDVKNVMHVINFDLPSADFNGQDEYIHRIGRTARIGNEGLATSFYNDDDEPMAQFLVNILLECGQDVPDFLGQYKPQEGTSIDFNDDSGVEENDELVNGRVEEEAWGTSSGDGANTTAAPVETEWNATDATSDDAGW